MSSCPVSAPEPPVDLVSAHATMTIAAVLLLLWLAFLWIMQLCE